MLKNFPFYSTTHDGLTPLSAGVARDMISKYNIYFRIYAVPSNEYGYRNFDFNLIDHNIYQMDNLKCFDNQHSSIKSINFEFDSTVYFYTDYKENEALVKNRLELACEVLKSKSKSITLTNLKSETKLKKDVVSNFINSLEKNQTASLFEERYEGISPHIQKEKNYKQPKGVSTVAVSTLDNLHLAVGPNNFSPP